MDEHEGHNHRKAHHSEKTKGNLISRLRKVEGQIRGITRMVEEDLYCDDVLNQIRSVESALNGIRKMLLEAHIKSCVVEQIHEGRQEVVEELMTTIGKMVR
ncbi:MAG: metal-sensing transcriptional repressor [Spirochaetales bacterium]|nr:MAG: metal-sensing transcriptional repressor [Spirochaetales bacterium]